MLEENTEKVMTLGQTIAKHKFALVAAASFGTILFLSFAMRRAMIANIEHAREEAFGDAAAAYANALRNGAAGGDGAAMKRREPPGSTATEMGVVLPFAPTDTLIFDAQGFLGVKVDEIQPTGAPPVDDAPPPPAA